MTDGRFFADVELPFHVWVREGAGDNARWVLREAPGLAMASGGKGPPGDGGAARGVGQAD